DFIIAKLLYKGYQDYIDALACWVRYEQQLNIDYINSIVKKIGVDNHWQAIQKKITVDKIFPDE
ncbi:MAG: hypothetical protein ACTSWY_00605, partial [Promethearchaeota archaeon]